MATTPNPPARLPSSLLPLPSAYSAPSVLRKTLTMSRTLPPSSFCLYVVTSLHPYFAPAEGPASSYSHLSANPSPLRTIPFRMRSSPKHSRNPFGMRSFKTQDLKSFRMCSSEKPGVGAPHVADGSLFLRLSTFDFQPSIDYSWRGLALAFWGRIFLFLLRRRFGISAERSWLQQPHPRRNPTHTGSIHPAGFPPARTLPAAAAH